jgi:hypothetical protein
VEAVAMADVCWIEIPSVSQKQNDWCYSDLPAEPNSGSLQHSDDKYGNRANRGALAMMLDITALEPVFGGEDSGDIIEPGIMTPTIPWLKMIPFPATFYPDDIQIQRAVWIKKGGNNIPDYPNPPEPWEKGSVQSKDVNRADPATGRLTVQTMHSVRVPTDRNLKSMDRIIWLDKFSRLHTLVVEGPATPKGIGDIQIKVMCTEKI